MSDATYDKNQVDLEITVLPGPILHLIVKDQKGGDNRILKVNLDRKTALNVAFSLIRKVVTKDDRS